MNPTAKGVRTSEGMITVAAVIGAVVAALAPLDQLVQVVAIVSATPVAVAYIVTRAGVKRAAIAEPPTRPRAKGTG